MREKLFRFFIWSMVWVLAGTSVAFAQGSKTRSVIKYVPPALVKDAKDIRWVVNPKLPLHSDRFIIEHSGGTVNHAEALRKYNAKKSSSKSSRKLPGAERQVPPKYVEQELPAASTPSFAPSYLTGVQALKTLRPGWRSELLLAGFNEREVLAIEETFAETDELLFELDEEGNWLSPLGNDWEYSKWFSIVLTNKIALNEPQVKTLFGKFSRLDDVFTRLNLQTFWLVNKRAPKRSASGAEGTLAQHVRYNIKKMHPGMKQEVEKYIYGPKKRASKRTPDDVLKLMLQFIEDHNQRFPSEYAEDEEERSLRKAFNKACSQAKAQNLKDGTSQRLLALKEQWVKKYADAKTPQEIYDYVTQFMPKHNDKLPSQYSTDPVEVSYSAAVKYFHSTHKHLSEEELKKLDETSRELEILCRKKMRENAKTKTTQDMYDYVTKFMPEHHGKWPAKHSTDPVEKSYALALSYFHSTRKHLSEEKLNELDEVSRKLEILCRENIKEYKTPQQMYDYATKFMAEHNGKFPSAYSKDSVEKSYARALYHFHSTHKDLSEEELEKLDKVSRDLKKLCREKFKSKVDTPTEVVSED